MEGDGGGAMPQPDGASDLLQQAEIYNLAAKLASEGTTTAALANAHAFCCLRDAYQATAKTLSERAAHFARDPVRANRPEEETQ